MDATDQVSSPLEQFCGVTSSTKKKQDAGNHVVTTTQKPSGNGGTAAVGLPKGFKNKYDLTLMCNRDCYPNCFNEMYNQYHLPNVFTAISSSNSMAEDYLSARYVKSFLRLGFVCMTLTSKTALSKLNMEDLIRLLKNSKRNIFDTSNDDEQDPQVDPILAKIEPSPSLFLLTTKWDREGTLEEEK